MLIQSLSNFEGKGPPPPRLEIYISGNNDHTLPRCSTTVHAFIPEMSAEHLLWARAVLGIRETTGRGGGASKQDPFLQRVSILPAATPQAPWLTLYILNPNSS